LYYWVEKGSRTGGKVRVWINVPCISPNGTTISVRQDSGPSPYLDPGKVFLFFDDFQNIDPSMWNYSSENISLVADGVKIKANASSNSSEDFE
jgi:hypothetical protein